MESAILRYIKMGLGNPYRLRDVVGRAREPRRMERPTNTALLVQAPTSVAHGKERHAHHDGDRIIRHVLEDKVARIEQRAARGLTPDRDVF